MARTKSTPTKKSAKSVAGKTLTKEQLQRIREDNAARRKTDNQENGQAQSSTAVVGKKRRAKSGQRVNQQIKLLQRTTTLCIPKASFQRVVKQEMSKHKTFDGSDFRITREALDALHEATEDYMVQFFDQCRFYLASHGRNTLMPKHMKFMTKLREWIRDGKFDQEMKRA